MNVGFSGHVALLNQFLDRRREIVENVEGRLLNVRGKDASRTRNREYFAQHIQRLLFRSAGRCRASCLD